MCVRACVFFDRDRRERGGIRHLDLVIVFLRSIGMGIGSGRDGDSGADVMSN